MPTYFITGSNRGIGLECVRQLSSSPSNTIIAGVRSLAGDLAELKRLSDQREQNNIHIIQCDVSTPAGLPAIVPEVVKILSQSPSSAKINFIFNIAGINATSSDTSLTMTPESMHRHIDINVLGPQKIVQLLDPYIADGAMVMNVTSGLGSLTVASEIPKCTTYSISKAALNMLTVHQAHDLKGRAKVICMDPGWVKTRMGGAGATVEAQDSVKGILSVVDGLTDGDSGKFYEFGGTIVKW